MKQFFLLLKIDLINTFKGNKKNKKKSLSGAFAYILSFGIMLGIFIPVEISFLNMLADNGAEAVFLPIIVIFSLFLSAMTIFRTAPSFLFNFKDHDLLFSLPISKRTILLEKVTKLHLFELIYSLVIVVPAIIIYALKFNLGPINPIVGIITFSIFSLLITTIFTSISMLIMLVASKTRFVEAIHTFLAVALSILFSGGISFASSYIGARGINSEFLTGIISSISTGLTLPIQWWADSFLTLNPMSTLKLCLISVIPFVIMVLLFSKMFSSINANLQEKRSGKKKALKVQKSSSVFKSLVNKEFALYFKTPQYAFQTLFGAAMAAVFLIVLIVLAIMNRDMLMTFITGDLNLSVTSGQTLLILMLVLGIGYFTNLAPMSAASISVEAKSLWILGTTPVSYRQTILAKSIIHPIVAGVPFAVLIAVLCAVSGLFTIAGGIFTVVIFLLFSILYSNIGMFVNLRFQKFNWNTHAEIFKSGIPTVVMVLLEFVLIAIIGGGYFLLNSNLNPGNFELSSYNLIFIAGLTLLLIVLNILLFASNLGPGAKRLENIIKDN